MTVNVLDPEFIAILKPLAQRNFIIEKLKNTAILKDKP
jgi:hypothetical protein